MEHSYEFLMRRMFEEDTGAKLTWLVAAALFYFGWDVLGYMLVGTGCLEMTGSLVYLRKAEKLEKRDA